MIMFICLQLLIFFFFSKGTHPDQIAMMQEINNKREYKIRRARAKREIQLLSHKKKFEASVHQANITFKVS